MRKRLREPISYPSGNMLTTLLGTAARETRGGAGLQSARKLRSHAVI
jgi:hypothetical protein